MTKEYLICPICGAQTSDYFLSTSGNLITDVKCTNRKCFFSSNYVPINTWDRFMKMVEKCTSLEAENATLTLLHSQATDQMIKMQDRVHELEAENKLLNAVLDKAIAKLAYFGCPSGEVLLACDKNSDDNACPACWREYLLRGEK